MPPWSALFAASPRGKATLNTSSANPFYQIAAQPLGAAGVDEGCSAVIVEANFHNPQQSTAPSHAYAGVYVGSAFGVSVKANVCSECARRDHAQVCTALGGNISKDEALFESALNIGWEKSSSFTGRGHRGHAAHASLAYLASLE
jgi:hypothetical protein